MRITAKLLAACAALVMASPPALSQTISARWPGTYKYVYLHLAMPTGCDLTLQRSVTSWNNQGSRFYYNFDPATNLTSDRIANVNNSNVNVEDGYPDNPAALMQTLRRSSGTSIIDADIIVKSSYLWYYSYSDESGGLFHCETTAPPTSEWDYQSAMTHELGHALGFDEANNTACVMHSSLGKGVVRRNPCSIERSAIQGTYGT
jgi:hypothetical protein